MINTQIKIHPSLKNFVKPDAHSKFSPSSADRWWGGCSYSIGASVGIVEESSIYAVEGTLAHSVCEAVFRQKEIGLPIPMDLTFSMLALKDRGDEMMGAAEEYYEVCRYWMDNKDLVGDILWYGQERAIPVYPEKSCYGTGDFVIVGTKSSVVIDFKYGRKNVNADSKQLKVYAAGIARHLDGIPDDYKFHAVIFQPRVGNAVKEVTYSKQQMYADLGTIWQSLIQAEKKDLEPVEGSHCFWCPAKRTTDLKKRCQLILNKPLKVAQENFAKFMADSNLMPDTVEKKVKRDEAIIKLMALLPAIEDIVSQSMEDFKRRLEAGEHIPGVILKEKLGNRKLNAENDTDAMKMIKALYPDVNPLRVETKTSIRPIGDLEKELGKGSMDTLCVRKSTKVVEVLDEKTQSILSSMSDFAKSISNS